MNRVDRIKAKPPRAAVGTDSGDGDSPIVRLQCELLELAAGGIYRDNQLAFRRHRQQVALAAGTDAPVLVQGEFGVGKEAMARTIHLQGLDADELFLRASLSDSRFTAATSSSGHEHAVAVLESLSTSIEQASGGTIYLLGLETARLPAQELLLKWVRRLEADRPRRRWRLITATTRDLKPDLEAGLFSRELFLLLSVLHLELAPLRERRADLPVITQALAEAAARRYDRPVPQITPAQARLLAAYDWPGNLRELQNLVERGVILAAGGLMRLDFAGATLSPAADRGREQVAASTVLTRDEWRRRERDNLAAALARAQGRIFGPAGAARVLGMKPTTLLSRIRALGVSRPPGRAPNQPVTPRSATPSSEVAVDRAPAVRRRRASPQPAGPAAPSESAAFEVSFD